MNFSVSDLGDCKVSVQVTIPQDKIAEKKLEVMSEFRKLPVPGHRPGKASLEVIKFRFKNQIEARLKETLAEEAYNSAIAENNLRPLGQPQFQSLNLADNFTCDFTLHTKPAVELAQYRDFQLPKPEAGVTAQEFGESLLQELRERNGQTVPYSDDDFVQAGDSVILDYTGTIDGVERPELTANKEVITIGGSPFKAFDENLFGMKMGDERTFDVLAPDTSATEYHGKTLTFNVKLVMGSKTIPAPLDDALAQRLSFANLDELRQHVSGISSNRIEDHQQTGLAQQVAARLVESHEVAVPSWLRLAEAQATAERQKLNWEELTDERREEMLSAADKSIKLSLILEKIRETEPEAQLSEEELQSHMFNELAKITKSPDPQNVEKVLGHLQQNGMLPVLVGKIRDEFTLNFLVKTSTIVE